MAVLPFLSTPLAASGPFPTPYPVALAECRCWSRASSRCVAPTDCCWWPQSQPASLSPWQRTLQRRGRPRLLVLQAASQGVCPGLRLSRAALTEARVTSDSAQKCLWSRNDMHGGRGAVADSSPSLGVLPPENGVARGVVEQSRGPVRHHTRFVMSTLLSADGGLLPGSALVPKQMISADMLSGGR